MNIVSNVTALANSVATDIYRNYESAISERGRFSIAISGGNTPRYVFQALRREFGQRINWDAVHIFWTDERIVKPDDEDSNYYLARNYLLTHTPGANVYRIKGEVKAREAAISYSEVLDNYFNNYDRKLDYIMLGMGEDGHTASLFPNVDYTSDSKHAIATLTPINDYYRVSLALSVINDARQRLLMITNDKKLAVIENSSQLPVHSLIKENTTLMVVK